MRAFGSERGFACPRSPFGDCIVPHKLGTEDSFCMEYSEHGNVADKWNWRTTALWIGPPTEISIMLILLVAGYVIYRGLS